MSCRQVIGRERAASGKFGFDFGVNEMDSEESTADADPDNRRVFLTRA